MMKLGWVVGRLDPQNSCTQARVIRPHEQLRAAGFDSRIYDADSPVEQLRECDVLLFHREPARIREVAGRGILLGFDLADDLFSRSYAALGVDFLTTDSLPNTRFYLSKHTHYWPHGFPDNTKRVLAPAADETRFVWCGAPENLHTLLGDPLAALEAVGQRRPVSLRIITNVDGHREKWLGNVPELHARNFRIEWCPFKQETHESLMIECDAGLFPQATHLDRWRKKSMYKPSHAASLGLPAISSPTEEVCMNFTHGVNALLPSNTAEWQEAVEAMSDVPERNRLRANVLELFRARFTLELSAQQILTIVRLELVSAREQRFRALRSLALRTYVAGERVLNAIQRRLPPRS
jgi:glycosyltransferase involved in cell wall biosynthesis